MNALTALGVAGFRIDASKHMWTEDLKIIFDMLNTLGNALNISCLSCNNPDHR